MEAITLVHQMNIENIREVMQQSVRYLPWLPWQGTLTDGEGSEAGSLNKSCLDPALGVTKFANVRDMILVTLCWAT